MKIVWIFLVLGLLFLGACKGEQANEQGEEMAEPSTEDVSIELENIKTLNEELLNVDPKKSVTGATALFNASSAFVNEHPNHVKTPAVMEVAAKASEAMGKPQQAINILDKLVNEFPVTDQTPKYMANMARIYEEKLGDNEKAKEVYLELIAKFPNDPLAIESENYMNNYLGKSDAEILMFLDSIQNAQQ